MQTRKTAHNWAIAAAVAAMLAASTTGARAQDANANPTTSPGTTTTVPDSSATGATTPPGTSGTPGGMNSGNMNSGGNMSTGSMSGGMMSGAMGTDYSILSNPAYDYIDLQQAKARGLSDSQIATIAKISKESGEPFRMVSAAVERGQTFPSLAGEYNLKLADVYSADKEKQEIANYISTYESIGTKNGSSGMPMMGGMDTSNMNGSGMSGGMSGDMGTSPAPMAGSSTTGSMTTTPAPMSGDMSSNMATMDIVDTAMAAKNLTTLVKALQVANLVETLKGAGPFTVFAPTDQAFSRLPAGQLDALLADPAKLKTILTYHVLPASVMAADAMAMTSPTSPPTVQGGTLQVTKGRRGRLRVNDATVTKADIKATNGVIHIIDRVLMPPMDMATPAAGTDTTTPAPGTTPPPAPAPAQ